MHVLIAMSDTGGGHRSVARAIEAGLRQLAPGTCDVDIVDIFSQGRATILDRFTRLYSPTIRYMPWLYGLVYHISDHPTRYRAFYSGARASVFRRTVKVLSRTKPDVIVSVHPLGNRLLLDARQTAGLSAPVVAVVTELVSVHASWVDPQLDLYITATPETYGAILRRGIPPERVQQLGLPVGSQFGSIETSPQRLREQLGLDRNRFTALLIGGGEGVGLGPIVDAVARANVDAQLLVICGRNDRLRRRLVTMEGGPAMRVFGFVSNVAELMHAADVVVTKGGPQTIAETLASGRPVVATHELPGQEKGNGDFVERYHAGYAAFTPSLVVAALNRLSVDRAERERLAANARALSRPNAALDTARAILELASEPVHLR